MLSARSVTRSAGMEAVTSPSASGVMVKVKFWLADPGPGQRPSRR